MSAPDLASIHGAIVAAVKTQLTANGVTLRLYDRDKTPLDPQAPYCVADPVPSGYGWDTGYDRTPTCGWTAIQFTAVGKARVDAMWVLDKIRDALLAVDPSTVSATGAAVRSVLPEDPPGPSIEAGDLINIPETYAVYVEAA